MKKINLQLLIVPALALSACGKFQKNPVSDLNEVRREGKLQTEIGPEKPSVPTPEPIYIDRDRIVTVQESSVGQNDIIITTDANMTFSEGMNSSYKVRARAVAKDVQISLSAVGLPDGAILTKSAKESEVYILSWTPALYTIGNGNVKSIPVKFSALVSTTSASVDVKRLNGLVVEKTSTLILTKNNEAPSELKIDGLAGEVSEGTVTGFTATVKVPGTNQSAVSKPRLIFSYDGVNTSPGNEFQELDGSRHILVDANKREPEYLGDSKWKFSFVFDTKSISVKSQLARDGSVMKAADGSRVRFSMKVFNLENGASTPELLKQVKIKYTHAIEAPRFDLSGLAPTNIVEMSRGESFSLKFLVNAADPATKVVVTMKNSTVPGSPKLNCQPLTEGPGRLECQLTWTVPCTTTASKLAGSIDLRAVSSLEGRESSSTEYSIKTSAAAIDKNLCAGAK